MPVMEHPGDEIEQALRAVDWTAHGADPTVVMSAVRQLRAGRSLQEGQDADNEVLDTIGYNHSGWLYDAAGPAAATLRNYDVLLVNAAYAGRAATQPVPSPPPAQPRHA